MAKRTKSLRMKVRYYQDSTPLDVPCREERFIRREIQMKLPIDQTVLVLVDLWDRHFIDSWMERAARVTQDAIVPAIERSRAAGILVVHAPSPQVALRFSQISRNPDVQQPQEAGPVWPPGDFKRREGAYHAFAGPRNQPPGIDIHWGSMSDDLTISPAIEVRDEDVVISNGFELHHILAERGVLHLIYAGFATNWCVLGRD